MFILCFIFLPNKRLLLLFVCAGVRHVRVRPAEFQGWPHAEPLHPERAHHHRPHPQPEGHQARDAPQVPFWELDSSVPGGSFSYRSI